MNLKKDIDLAERKTEIGAVLLILIVFTAGIGYADDSGILNAGSSGDSGLVAEYRFEEGAGDTAYDTAGGNDGAINGAKWTKGVKGKALIFDGSDDYAVDNSGVNVNEKEITVSTWVRPDSYGWSRVVMHSDHDHYQIDLSDKGEWRLRVYDDTGSYKQQLSDPISNGKWSHICWIRDNRAQEVDLYKNGESWSDYRTNTEWDTPTESSKPLMIGEGYTNTFDGKLDDVRIYPYALSEKEVEQVINGGGVSVGG